MRLPRPLHAQIRAARLGYLFPAAVIALWAALIPYLRETLNLSAPQVTQLVFAFGAGSIAGMAAAGPLTKYTGSRFTCSAAAAGSVICIFMLALFPPFVMALACAAAFALCAGLLEVAVNIYGVGLEREYKLRLITPLHAYYSAGEVLGALCCLIFLTCGVPPLWTVCCFTALLTLCACCFFPAIVNFDFKGRGERAFMLPDRITVCLCLIVLFTYMTGGAMVDWSGIFLHDYGSLTLKQAVLGYALVSLSMLCCRIYGNRLTKALGALPLVLGGAALMILGLAMLWMRLPLPGLLLGFIFIGCGMANITPLSYAAAARRTELPLLPTVSLMSAAGYGGILAGPALLGAAASLVGLPMVFLLLALLCLVSLVCMIRLSALYRSCT